VHSHTPHTTMADHFASPTRAAAKEHDNIKLLQAGSPCTALIQLEPTRSLEFVGNETRIAMELCEGGDMGRCGNLKPGSLASSFQIKAVVRPVLRGLRRLEERRCVHGDIKGANIVIGGANLKDDAEVKICDFGSSTLLPPSGSGCVFFLSPYPTSYD
jgi:serine/threonine protein kinase